LLSGTEILLIETSFWESQEREELLRGKARSEQRKEERKRSRRRRKNRKKPRRRKAKKWAEICNRGKEKNLGISLQINLIELGGRCKE
jgi:hypothetical protein